MRRVRLARSAVSFITSSLSPLASDTLRHSRCPVLEESRAVKSAPPRFAGDARASDPGVVSGLQIRAWCPGFTSRGQGAMEWDKAKASAAAAGESVDGMGGGEALGYVKVMTDEQMEVLRKQISIYATICEQLVELHRTLTVHHESIAGLRLGNMYCDPLMVHGGHKITSRQRWTPTQMQLQILESIFDQGNGTPSKQRIKDITAELSQHGQISETNVYNWFQNRRARSKRKQAASLPNNAEYEAEADEESPTDPADKKPRSDGSLHQNMVMTAHNPERISGMHHFDAEHEQIRGVAYGSSDSSSRLSGSLGQMPFYENIMSNSRLDHFMGKVEGSGSFSQF